MASGDVLSSKEIFELINISPQSKNYVIINSMIRDGLIVRTNDNPKSPNQRYKITAKGLDFLNNIHE